MNSSTVHGTITGPIVMIGFGSIGRGTLPLIERHLEFDRSRFVVIDPGLRDRLLNRERLAMRDLLAGSVQLYASRISALALDPIPGRPDLYWWPHAYDSNFLGYMAGALTLAAIDRGEGLIL